MDIQKSHEKFYQSLLKSNSVSELKKVLDSYSRFLRADYFVYACMAKIPISAPDVIAITNYPENWIANYTEKKYFDIDPTIYHCANSLKPIYWNEIKYASDESKNMMIDAENYGLVSGLTVPQHSPNGQFAVTSFCSKNRNDKKFYRRLKDEYSFIYLFCIHFHEKAIQIFELNLASNKIVELSGRERECLMWSAEGKSSNEIGEILGISERTIVFHINNASKKLNAVNRQQAIAKAIATGQIRSNANGAPIKYNYQAIS